VSEAASQEQFLRELAERKRMVDDLLAQPRYRAWFGPAHLRRAVCSYVERPGKRLRPAALLFACGAAGGREEDALPAAAAVEVFHTWTLVHDDLIDNDSLRRGRPTVHEEAANWAGEEFGYDEDAAREYGRDISVLTGDVQQAWSVALLLECAQSPAVEPGLVVALAHLLESKVINELICGEALDVQFSRRPIAALSEDEVVDMLRLKTGVLYGFAGTAGAAIGCGKTPGESDLVAAIGEFTARCGIAFQLQDDILGLIGDQARLGKPVGSDLREGKRTTIVLHAWRNASGAQRDALACVLGNRSASADEIGAATRLLVELGGVEHTQELAREHLARARAALERVPDSPYKSLFLAWAEYLVRRAF